MKIKMVDTFGQYEHIKTEVDAAIHEVVQSSIYINGPVVRNFASNLGKYMDTPYTTACANGTDALQIALMALDLKPGDEVLTPAFTFVATVEVIALLHLKPVFVEVYADTFNMDVEDLEEKITPNCKAIVPVHLFGQTANMEEVNRIAKKHGLAVVEDNAQAIGSTYTFSDGKEIRSGTIGDIGTTSFYPSKNLGAFGDAGAIFTRDAKLADRIQIICNHGAHKKYYHESIGVNSRLDAMQAAILDIKLKHLDEYNTARQLAASKYNELLKGEDGIVLPVTAPFSTHVFHQYTIRILAGRAKRDYIQKYLSENGIPSMIYYPVACHLQGAYRHYGFREGDLPVTEQLTEQVLSLPMHTELTDDQLQYITKHLKAALKQN